MSIIIKIEKSISLKSLNLNENKKVDETFTEGSKINLPKTNTIKSNNLSCLNKNDSKNSQKHTFLEEKSLVFSEEKTIRDILNNKLNSSCEQGKGIINFSDDNFLRKKFSETESENENLSESCYSSSNNK